MSSSMATVACGSSVTGKKSASTKALFSDYPPKPKIHKPMEAVLPPPHPMHVIHPPQPSAVGMGYNVTTTTTVTTSTTTSTTFTPSTAVSSDDKTFTAGGPGGVDMNFVGDLYKPYTDQKHSTPKKPPVKPTVPRHQVLMPSVMTSRRQYSAASYAAAAAAGAGSGSAGALAAMKDEDEPGSKAAPLMSNKIMTPLAHEMDDPSKAIEPSPPIDSTSSGFFCEDGTLNVKTRNEELMKFVVAQCGYIADDVDTMNSLRAFRMEVPDQETSIATRCATDGSLAAFIETLGFTNITLNAILLKCLCGAPAHAIIDDCGMTAKVSKETVKQFIPTPDLPQGSFKDEKDNWPILLKDWPTVPERACSGPDALNYQRLTLLLSVICSPNYCREIENYTERKVWRVWKVTVRRLDHLDQYVVCEKHEHYIARQKVFEQSFRDSKAPSSIPMFTDSGNLDYLKTRFYCSWFANECPFSLDKQLLSLLRIAKRRYNKNKLLPFLRNPDYAGKFEMTDFLVLPLLFCLSLGWGTKELMLVPISPASLS